MRHRFNKKAALISLIILILLGFTISHNNIEKEKTNNINTKNNQSKISSAENTKDVEENIIPIYNINLSQELQEHTFNECERWNIPYTLELGLLMRESNFDDKAVNGSCKGIGQLHVNTAKAVSDALQIKNFDIFNAEHNISCSVYQLYVLKESYSKRGHCDEDLFYYILGAYNRGSKRFDNYVERYGIESDYANDILEYKEQLETIGTIQ